MNKNSLRKLLVGTVCALGLGVVLYLFHFAQYQAPEIAKKRAEREAIKAKRKVLLTPKRQRTQKAQKTSDASKDWRTLLEELEEMLAEAEISEENENADVQETVEPETVETEETTAPSADESADGTALKKPSISPAEYQRLTEELEKIHELRNILNARSFEISDRRTALFNAANKGILTEEETNRELELIDKEDEEIWQQLRDLADMQVEIHRQRGTLVEEDNIQRRPTIIRVRRR